MANLTSPVRTPERGSSPLLAATSEVSRVSDDLTKNEPIATLDDLVLSSPSASQLSPSASFGTEQALEDPAGKEHFKRFCRDRLSDPYLDKKDALAEIERTEKQGLYGFRYWTFLPSEEEMNKRVMTDDEKVYAGVVEEALKNIESWYNGLKKEGKVLTVDSDLRREFKFPVAGGVKYLGVFEAEEFLLGVQYGLKLGCGPVANYSDGTWTRLTDVRAVEYTSRAT